MYAGLVFFSAVIAAIVFATMKGGPANSQSGSSAVAASPSAPAPASRFAADKQTVVVGLFYCKGKLGNVAVYVTFESSGMRGWDVGRTHDAMPREVQSGQYRAFGYAGGERVQAGGHAEKWYARLFGIAFSRREPAKRQRVVIKLSGRPNGTFALIPTEPGFLKRDSGTQISFFYG